MAPLPSPSTLLTLVHDALLQRSPTSTTPLLSNGLLAARAETSSAKHNTPTHDTHFGYGAAPAKDFNNKFFLALFALLGAAAALAGIWFFFWAKNGGFHFREGDWEDYKSTVLRRKGPDGRTLSNATKSTKLGGGSVVHGQRWAPRKGKWGLKKGGSFGASEGTMSSFGDDPKEKAANQQRESNGAAWAAYQAGRPQHGNQNDPALDEYRNEKAAKVGGLNRQHDGSHFDYSNTGSESTRPLVRTEKERKKREKAERAAREKAQKAHMKQLKAEAKLAQKQEKAAAKNKGGNNHNIVDSPTRTDEQPNTPRRAGPSAAYSFQHGDDEGSSHYTGPTASQEGSSYYYASYRPVATSSPAASPNNTPQSAQAHSSRYRDRRQQDQRHSTGSPTKARHHHHRHEESTSSDAGTKVYNHHIPGLSKGPSEVGVEDSVSQAGARRAAAASGGYRRGGGRRRDSLSDSD